MPPTIQRKFTVRQALLRATLTTAVAGSVLLAIVASAPRGVDDRVGAGLPRVRFLQASHAQDLEYWQDTISSPLPLEQVLVVDHARKSLDLQPFHVSSYPSGWVSDVHLATVAKAPWLEELRLGETCVTDEGIRFLTALHSLRILRLSRTRISDRALECLGTLHKLEMLDIDHTRVTDRGISHLSALQSLRVLQLGDTKISDRALLHLSKLTALEDLYLKNDRIGDDGLRHLVSLPKLGYLDLRATRVTDQGLTMLDQFPALEILRLDDCAISDAGIIHLGRIESLQVLDLFGAKGVTAAGVARLKEIRPGITICWQEKATGH